MNGVERLYFALGELVYAVAKSDGTINFEEKNKLHDLVVKEAKCHLHEFNVSEIIFHIMQKDQLFSIEESYQMAMKEINICSNYLTEDMKAEFTAVLEKVARAFGKFTTEEKALIARFRTEIDQL